MVSQHFVEELVIDRSIWQSVGRESQAASSSRQDSPLEIELSAGIHGINFVNRAT